MYDEMLVYLAQPYTHPTITVQYERYFHAKRVSANLRLQGVLIYSPIAETHAQAEEFSLGKEFDYWQTYCLRMVMACDALVVLKLPGWEWSVGLAAELSLARAAGKKIGWIQDPECAVIEWEPEEK